MAPAHHPSIIKQAKPAKASNLTTASLDIDNNMFTSFSFVVPPPQRSRSLPPPPRKQAKQRAPPVDHYQYNWSNGIVIGNASLKPGEEKAASSAVIVAIDRIVRPIIGESDKSGKKEEEGGGIGAANPLALE